MSLEIERKCRDVAQQFSNERHPGKYRASAILAESSELMEIKLAPVVGGTPIKRDVDGTDGGEGGFNIVPALKSIAAEIDASGMR